MTTENIKMFKGHYFTSDGKSDKENYFIVDESQELYSDVKIGSIYLTSGFIIEDVFVSIPALAVVTKEYNPKSPNDYWVINTILNSIKQGKRVPLPYLRFEFENFETMKFVQTDNVVKKYKKQFESWIEEHNIDSKNIVNTETNNKKNKSKKKNNSKEKSE